MYYNDDLSYVYVFLVSLVIMYLYILWPTILKVTMLQFEQILYLQFLIVVLCLYRNRESLNEWRDHAWSLQRQQVLGKEGIEVLTFVHTM